MIERWRGLNALTIGPVRPREGSRPGTRFPVRSFPRRVSGRAGGSIPDDPRRHADRLPHVVEHVETFVAMTAGSEATDTGLSGTFFGWPNDRI